MLQNYFVFLFGGAGGNPFSALPKKVASRYAWCSDYSGAECSGRRMAIHELIAWENNASLEPYFFHAALGKIVTLIEQRCALTIRRMTARNADDGLPNT